MATDLKESHNRRVTLAGQDETPTITGAPADRKRRLPSVWHNQDFRLLWAGQSVGLVTRRQPAGEIVREIVGEAERGLSGLAAPRPSNGGHV